MPREGAGQPEPRSLSEDEAHRVLARAVELDEQRSSDIPVAQLREVAREAGISMDAFELALRERRDLPRSSRGPIASQSLVKYRRHAFVLIVAIADLVTPGDLLFTSLALALPLYGLYELSIVLARRNERKGGRPSSPLSTADRGLPGSTPVPSRPEADRVSRSLLFRTA